MRKFFRFVYLNAYAFLLAFCGMAAISIPLFKISKWLLVLQIVVSLFCLRQSYQLFSTWKDKQRKYEILMGKNKDFFRPDSFKIFMQAPCGRLLTKAVLKDLGIRENYKELLVYKIPFLDSVKQNCVKQETKIYINEDF